MRIDKLNHTIFRAGHLCKRYNFKCACDIDEAEEAIGRFSYYDLKRK